MSARNRQRYGESMHERRARWKREGRCGDCGAAVDQPGSSRCARHRPRRNAANYRRRHVEFELRCPARWRTSARWTRRTVA